MSRPSDLPVRAVAACVFLSGAASLALETVWSRQFKLVFGSTLLAITTILVAYMLGLGLGGLAGGRVAARLKSGVRAYGWLEVAVGLWASCVPWLLSLYPGLHRTLAELGFWPAAFARFGLVLAALLLPTLAMGATLPILVQALVRERAGLAGQVGLFYGANTLGAVAGVLAATFVGFRWLGLSGTSLVAALADIAVGLFAILVLAPRVRATRTHGEPHAEPPRMRAAPTSSGAAAARLVPRPRPEEGAEGRVRVLVALLAYGVVGFTALAFEVAWTRGLALILGSSTYAFATILAGFLAGIGLGSLLARRRLDRLERPFAALAAGIAALGVSSLGVAWSFRWLPDLFLATFEHVGISGTSLVWLGLAFALVLMLVPTAILGALFPLVTRVAASGGRAHGRAVGAVYFANTLGSALGAFSAGFLLIPRLGLPTTLGLAIALDFLAAAAVFGAAGRRAPAVAASLVLALAVLLWPPAWDAEALARGVYYRSSVQLDFGLPKVPLAGRGGDELVFYEEGLNCTVSVHRMADGLEQGGVSMRVNGKTDASLADMSTQVLSGHLPFLFGGRAGERALVIGYASGITAGSAALWGGQVDVCEIEPAVIRASRAFDDVNHRPLENERVRLIVDDGRSWLAATDVRYDVIVSEPSNPWIAGCANLFTAEFFAIARGALAPGGRLLQWIQLYGMDAPGLASVLAALHEHFPYATGFLFERESTDLLLIASDAPLGIGDLARLEALPAAVRDDLARVRVLSSADLWSLVLLGPDELAALAAEAPETNTDDSMYVELAAPWALYDDTERTRELVRGRGLGLAPLLARAEPGAVGEELLGELALAYLRRRGETRLADAVAELLPPASPYAELYRGLRPIERSEGDPATSYARVRAAAERAPLDFAPSYHLGRLEQELGRHEAALLALERALAARPDHLEARHLRATSLVALGRMRAAYEETSLLLDSPLVETEPELWAQAAWLSGGFGRFEEAIARMERSLELEPYVPERWENLALWNEKLGRGHQAEEARANVALAAANAVRSLHWVARWHERFGTLREARLALEEVLRLDPDSAAARADLERLARR